VGWGWWVWVWVWVWVWMGVWVWVWGVGVGMGVGWECGCRVRVRVGVWVSGVGVGVGGGEGAIHCAPSTARRRPTLHTSAHAARAASHAHLQLVPPLVGRGAGVPLALQRLGERGQLRCSVPGRGFVLHHLGPHVPPAAGLRLELRSQRGHLHSHDRGPSTHAHRSARVRAGVSATWWHVIQYGRSSVCGHTLPACLCGA
jgi:hypothetical protein